jgi:hypothetical protein
MVLRDQEDFLDFKGQQVWQELLVILDSVVFKDHKV